MDLRKKLLGQVVRQFHRPTGPAGHVAGWVMGRRSSNVERSRWAVGLLDVQPTDRVVEFGCGPGVALAALAARADRGVVVGVDHSQVMLAQARRRNAAAVALGRLRLVNAAVDHLEELAGEEPFDAALAVNTVGFWPDPSQRLREIGALLAPGATIALVSQPRCPGATSATSAAAADELAEQLTAADFEVIRRERLQMDLPSSVSSPDGPSPWRRDEHREDPQCRGGPRSGTPRAETRGQMRRRDRGFTHWPDHHPCSYDGREVERYDRGMASRLAPGMFLSLGLIGAAVAYSKGRSLLGWLVLGVLLGPLALAASILVRRRS